MLNVFLPNVVSKAMINDLKKKTHNFKYFGYVIIKYHSLFYHENTAEVALRHNRVRNGRSQASQPDFI